MQAETRRLMHRIIPVCDMTGIGRTTLFKLIAEGKLDARKIGRRTLITDESLKKFIADLPRMGDGGL